MISGVREKVITLRKENPYLTLGQVGDQVGVTRERVRQILRSEKLPTHAKLPDYYFCADCGEKKSQNNRKKNFPRCTACISKDRYITLACTWCGTEKSFLKSARKRYNQNTVFCSKRCHGLWLSNGWGIRKGEGKRGQKNTNQYEINRQILITKRDNPEMTQKQIGELFGIRQSYVSLVLQGKRKFLNDSPENRERLTQILTEKDNIQNLSKFLGIHYYTLYAWKTKVNFPNTEYQHLLLEKGVIDLEW